MVNDSKTKITVEFNSEKVAALRMYMANKGLNVEEELVRTLETMYEKHVPIRVKDFISMKAESVQKKEKKSTKKVDESVSSGGLGWTEP